MSVPMETIINQQSENASETLADSGFYWRESSDGVKVLVCRALEENGFVNGFSTRLGGVSALPANDLNLSGFDIDTPENVSENRRRFLQIFGGDYKIASAHQTHGADVKIVADEKDAADETEKADALISNLPHILIGVKTADCVPVLLGDTKTKAFAAIHAGWRGTAASIGQIAIDKMREIYGTQPENLIAAIGAAATCKNYEIGQDVIDAFRANFTDGERYFKPTRKGHALVDLHAANRDQLADKGVLDENIFTAPFCTIERIDLFFSYRVERKLYGKTGRLMSVIGRA